MPFKEAQTNALEAKLSAKHVKSISRGGSMFSYVEGWHVISEANRVFGLAGWDRETVSTECIWQNKSQHQNACAYITRVRVCVRAAEQVVVRNRTDAVMLLGTLGEHDAWTLAVAGTSALSCMEEVRDSPCHAHHEQRRLSGSAP